MNGLKRIVQLRGGIEALDTTPRLRLLISWYVSPSLDTAYLDHGHQLCKNIDKVGMMSQVLIPSTNTLIFHFLQIRYRYCQLQNSPPRHRFSISSTTFLPQNRPRLFKL